MSNQFDDLYDKPNGENNGMDLDAFVNLSNILPPSKEMNNYGGNVTYEERH